MTVTPTLTDLTDATMYDLVGPGEQGRIVTLTADLDDSSTTLSLSDASGVNVSDTIEFDDELVLVTAKTADAVPVFTVQRGFYRSTAAAHTAASTVGYVNPPHPRVRVQEAIKRSFSRLGALGLPLVKATTLNRVTDLAHVELPEDVAEVYDVVYYGTRGRFHRLDGWEVNYHLPTSIVSTGKALSISTLISDTDDLEVIYRALYRWSSHPTAPVGSSTIEMLEGTDDLPSLYATAWVLSRREISRSEIDRSEEWARTEVLERGSSGALVRAAWQEFYRALDEARRLHPVPQPIHHRSRPRVLTV